MILKYRFNSFRERWQVKFLLDFLDLPAHRAAVNARF